MSLQVIVPTCDKYVHLMPGFFQQWNQYCGLPGMVVCEQVAPKVPAGWAHFRAGYQTPESHWAGNLRMALGQVHESVVLLLLEDYWLLEQVDMSHLNTLVEWFASDLTLDKIDLTNDRLGFAHMDYCDGYVRSTQDAMYLSSLQAALWRTSFLKKCLVKPGWNPWEFEVSGNNHMQQLDHKVLGSRKLVMRYANIVYRGQFAPKEIARLLPEDKQSLDSISAFQTKETS